MINNIQKLVFHIAPENVNQMIKAMGQGGKKWGYSKIKAKWNDETYFACRDYYTKPVQEYPIYLGFVIYRKDGRSDPTNLFEGSEKCILDGLQKMGIIINDGPKEIAATEFIGHYLDRENPRVEVVIIEGWKTLSLDQHITAKILANTICKSGTIKYTPHGE